MLLYRQWYKKVFFIRSPRKARNTVVLFDDLGLFFLCITHDIKFIHAVSLLGYKATGGAYITFTVWAGYNATGGAVCFRVNRRVFRRIYHMTALYTSF